MRCLIMEYKAHLFQITLKMSKLPTRKSFLPSGSMWTDTRDGQADSCSHRISQNLSGSLAWSSTSLHIKHSVTAEKREMERMNACF